MVEHAGGHDVKPARSGAFTLPQLMEQEDIAGMGTRMREIKFRIWLPSIKKMTHTHTIDELMTWRAKAGDSLAAIFMQYTGIKDKNGTEIYEGDIVFLAAGVSCLTVFDEEKASFCTEYYRNGEKKHSQHMYGAHMTEVGGNRYENPELWPY